MQLRCDEKIVIQIFLFNFIPLKICTFHLNEKSTNFFRHFFIAQKRLGCLQLCL